MSDRPSSLLTARLELTVELTDGSPMLPSNFEGMLDVTPPP